MSSLTEHASTQLEPVVIIGAGRTGRGLAAVLCQRSQLPVVLVDRDQALVTALRAAGSYAVSVLGSRPAQSITIHPRQVYHLSERSWHRQAERARVLFTAVFGTNLAGLAADLAAIALARHAAGAGPLDIITCENLTHAARVLRDATAQAMPSGSPSLSSCRISFVEAMVLTTSLASATPEQPLTVRPQNAFRLPCDGDALQAGNPGITGLEGLPRFEHQLQRKIYTYNGINAVISYLGAQRGHLELAAATRDPEITPWAIQAGQEASAALIAQYGFSEAEQLQWQTDALAKFADQDIPDPILRNAADPARKLARDDRLVGPALLALTHGVKPLALSRGIVAAAEYCTPSEPSLLQRHGSLEAVLKATAGLDADHPLLALVTASAKTHRHGSAR
jgi:mannitol-1-phosphate 5-dehydrogenase